MCELTGTDTMTYNKANQLATATGGGNSGTYAYDAFGQRLKATPPSFPASLFSFDRQGNMLTETDNGVEFDYVYLDNVPVAVIKPSTATISYIHTGRLGTPQLATDATKATVWSLYSQPFGEGMQSGSAMQNLRMPGQYADNTGYSHNGFRNYNSAIGRYLESDPIGLRGGTNTYVYVRSNPGKWIDALGLDPISLLPGPPAGTQQAASGLIQSTQTTQNMTAYRYFGGQTPREGSFLSPTLYSSPEAARDALSLPPENSATGVCQVNIPAGTQIQTSEAAANFGQSGGGPQIQLLQKLPSNAYQTIPNNVASAISGSTALPPIIEFASPLSIFFGVLLYSPPAH